MCTSGSSYVYMPKLLLPCILCLFQWASEKLLVSVLSILKKRFYWAVIILLAKNTIINTTVICLLKGTLFWDTTWVLSPWSSNTFLFCSVPYPSTLFSFLLVLFYSMLHRNILLIKTDYFIFSRQTTIEETNTFNILAKLKVAGFPHF